MNHFENILVAASPGHLEPMVLRAAVKLAETNRARLTVLDVTAPAARMRRFTTVGHHAFDVRSESRNRRSEALRRLAENTRAGDGTEVKVVVGEPFVEVIRHVLEHDNDLVIVGGRTVENSMLPGLPSGVMDLLRECPVPVWVMRPPRAGTRCILALIDPDPDDPRRDGLNDTVLRLASSVAHREGGELHVGHACDSTLRSSPNGHLPGKVADVQAEMAEGVRREQLEALLERHHVVEAGAEVHLVAGRPGDVLPKLARRLGAGLIVMGTVARTGISGWIAGNTAEKILQSVHCSVLVVKPEGFLTSVKPIRTKARGRQ